MLTALKSFMLKAKAKAVKKLNYKAFLEYRDQLFEESYTKATLYGNLSEEQARAIWREVREKLDSKSFRKEEHPKQETVYLPQHHGPYFVERKLKLVSVLALRIAASIVTFRLVWKYLRSLRVPAMGF